MLVIARRSRISRIRWIKPKHSCPVFMACSHWLDGISVESPRAEGVQPGFPGGQQVRSESPGRLSHRVVGRQKQSRNWRCRRRLSFESPKTMRVTLDADDDARSPTRGPVGMPVHIREFNHSTTLIELQCMTHLKCQKPKGASSAREVETQL